MRSQKMYFAACSAPARTSVICKNKCRVMRRNSVPAVLNRCTEDKHQQSRDADPPGREKVKNCPH